jgi:hypothetical protein
MTRHFTRLVTAAAVAGVTLAAVVAASPAGATQDGPPAAPSNGRFYGVAALSATDAWAVGLHPNAFVAHWDGTSWTPSHSSNGFFTSVAASGPDDVWAAGGTNWFHAKTMIDHWDGTTWTQVPTPRPGTASYFRGVAADSATDAWAVGVINNSPADNPASGTKTLIEHWDGTAWTRVPSPSPRPVNVLYAVAAVSPTDAWAAGWTGRTAGQGGHLRALILHWDGTAWTQVPTPPQVSVTLSGVAATSASDAWAVGKSHLFGHTQTYILHWDGTNWTHVPSPNPKPGGDVEAVTALSPTDAWATGANLYKSDCNPKCRTLTEHWDGTAWTIVPSPNPPSLSLNFLLGVAGTASNDVWAVGTTDFNATLIEHWDGTAWTQVPSPQDRQVLPGTGLLR